MIRSLIIQNNFKEYIPIYESMENTHPEFNVFGYTSSLDEGLKYITYGNPDLVFMDTTVFNSDFNFSLENLAKQNFKSVLISSENVSHSIENSFFIHVINDPLVKGDVQESLRLFMEGRYKKNYKGGKIVIPSSNNLFYIDLDEILYVESDGNYSIVHLFSQQSIHCNYSIKKLECSLTNTKFVRIHKRFLVNMDKIFVLDSEKSQIQFSSIENKLPVSRTRKKAVMDYLKCRLL